MIRNRTSSILGALAICAAAALEVHARPSPLGTVFTYQGELKLNGNLINNTADFQFTLFDALSRPNQIGPMVPVNNVAVASGLFTVPIDFGSSVFDGNDRYLQIAVRSPSGIGVFNTLTPRQKLTAAPYALQTRGVFVDNSLNVGLGTTAPQDDLHVAGTTATLRLEDTTTPGGFTQIYDAQPTQLRINKVNNNGLVLLDINPKPADGVSNASVRLFRETNTIGLKSLQLHRGNNTSQLSALIGVDGGDSFFQAHGGNLGIGTTTPTNTLSVVGAADFDQVAINTTPSDAGALVVAASGSFEAGIHVFGLTHGLVAETLFAGGGAAVIGACSSTFGFDFLADGFGSDYGSSSSIRWKRNIEPIDDPLGKLADLRGVYFDWDAAHGGHHAVGMIAEEVGAVLPEIVSYEENGVDATGMDYSKLTPLLVEAVKALREEKDSQIAELQLENEHLRERLLALECTVAAFAAASRQGDQP